MSETKMNEEMVTNDKREIELVSKDSHKLRVKRSHILMSGLVKDILEDDDDDNNVIPSIPIPNVVGSTLTKIIEYCNYHWNNRAIEIEKPLKSKIEDVICDWDKKFLEIDHSLLIALIMAANYMNISDLLNLTCAKIASMIKGKSPEQIRGKFEIENDFTPQEEAEIREETKWCQKS